MNNKINELNSPQRQRLAFIDFCLEYFGQISRNDLAEHFSVGVTSCSRDFAIYKQLAGSNLLLRHSDKLYIRSPEFQPLFTHSPNAVLSNLANGFGDGISTRYSANTVCFDAVHLIHPKPRIIASIMRTIMGEQALQIIYHSLSSGSSERVIVPHAVVNTGHRWHIRAYDKKNHEFRDFVCTRLEDATQASKKPLKRENAQFDKSWNNIISLELVPHPKLNYRRAVEMDYGMSNGIKTIQIREALVGYLLRYWNVDCSENASLPAPEHLLYLKNNAIISGIASNVLAPGYEY